MNLYGIQLTIIDIGWESYQSADILLPIGGVNTQLDANPQYDKSRRISQSISNINSISDLRSWSDMRPEDYQKISDYISNDQSTVTETEASQTLMNYIVFKRANFQKESGKEDIVNTQNAEADDDGTSYKVDDVPFSTYAVTRNRIIQNIFNQYQGFTIKNIETLQEVRDQIIISADAKNLYITQNYEIDCKTFVISSADFKLINTLEEFPDGEA